MPRVEEGYDEEDFEGEPEYPPEADEAGELWCPECGAVLYADSTRCPRCKEYVTPGARPGGAMPAWVWVGMGVLAAAVLTALVARIVF